MYWGLGRKEKKEGDWQQMIAQGQSSSHMQKKAFKKQIQNPTVSHHLHCYHSGLSHHRSSPVLHSSLTPELPASSRDPLQSILNPEPE